MSFDHQHRDSNIISRYDTWPKPWLARFSTPWLLKSPAKELIKTPKLRNPMPSKGNPLWPPSPGASLSKLRSAAHQSLSGLPLHSSKQQDQEPRALRGHKTCNNLTLTFSFKEPDPRWAQASNISPGAQVEHWKASLPVASPTFPGSEWGLWYS